MKLVVVESPAKAKTIEKYLGPGHRVLASYGHVRDLPPKDGSVDPDQGFAMEWETYPDKARQVKAIADDAKKADTLILATDPDREGEAISWHVQEVLQKRKALPAHVERVTFNAITKQGTNELSGVAFGFLQDASMTQKRRPASTTRYGSASKLRKGASASTRCRMCRRPSATATAFRARPRTASSTRCCRVGRGPGLFWRTSTDQRAPPVRSGPGRAQPVRVRGRRRWPTSAARRSSAAATRLRPWRRPA